jgi:hypothetical protein
LMHLFITMHKLHLLHGLAGIYLLKKIFCSNNIKLF